MKKKTEKLVPKRQILATQPTMEPSTNNFLLKEIIKCLFFLSTTFSPVFHYLQQKASKLESLMRVSRGPECKFIYNK